LIKNHVFFSQFLTWLEQNTEANIYYTSMVLSSNNQITFDGIAKTPADITEQIAAFEASPEVAGVSLSNATFSSFMNGWTFNVVLTMQPSVFTWTPGTSPSAAVTSAPAEMSATTTSAAATGASGAATSTATP
jgi:hypothetical protein